MRTGKERTMRKFKDYADKAIQNYKRKLTVLAGQYEESTRIGDTEAARKAKYQIAELRMGLTAIFLFLLYCLYMIIFGATIM